MQCNSQKSVLREAAVCPTVNLQDRTVPSRPHASFMGSSTLFLLPMCPPKHKCSRTNPEFIGLSNEDHYCYRTSMLHAHLANFLPQLTHFSLNEKRTDFSRGLQDRDIDMDLLSSVALRCQRKFLQTSVPVGSPALPWIFTGRAKIFPSSRHYMWYSFQTEQHFVSLKGEFLLQSRREWGLCCDILCSSCPQNTHGAESISSRRDWVSIFLQQLSSLVRRWHPRRSKILSLLVTSKEKTSDAFLFYCIAWRRIIQY